MHGCCIYFSSPHTYIYRDRRKWICFQKIWKSVLFKITNRFKLSRINFSLNEERNPNYIIKKTVQPITTENASHTVTVKLKILPKGSADKFFIQN